MVAPVAIAELTMVPLWETKDWNVVGKTDIMVEVIVVKLVDERVTSLVTTRVPVEVKFRVDSSMVE